MPARMTEKLFNAVYGLGDLKDAVQFVGQLDSTIQASDLPPGTVYSLNSSGKLVLGVGALTAMPLFGWNGSLDPSVQNQAPANNAVGAYIPINPGSASTGPKITTYPAIFPAEWCSVNYVSASYPPNTPLTSPTSTGNAGKLVAGTLAANTICGIVSRGLANNGYGTTGLYFWSWFHPPHAALA